MRPCLRAIVAAVTMLASTPAFSAPARPATAVCRAALATPEFDRMQDAAWYLPTADGKTRLYVTELGCGAPVVFLHGGPGNDFQYFVPALRPHLADHRFILVEQRGSLLSPVPADQVAGLSADTLVGDLETLRTALGVERLTIVGHSWGTMLALLYAQRHPEHVERLVLTAAFPSYLPGGLSQLLTEMRARQNALRARPAVAAELVRAGLPADSASDTPRQATARRRLWGNAALNVYHIDRWRQFFGAGVYFNTAAAEAISGTVPKSFDFRDVPERTGRPVTVIQGDQDYIGPSAPSWRGIRGVTVKTLRSAGHYGWIDDPTGFHAALAVALAP